MTIRDIAKEAGVSIATVSYVLNNREDQCISEATRQKILQIVNLHQYRINFTAKCISSGKTNIVTLFVGRNKSPLYKAEAMRATERLYKFGIQCDKRTKVYFSEFTEKLLVHVVANYRVAA